MNETDKDGLAIVVLIVAAVSGTVLALVLLPGGLSAVLGVVILGILGFAVVLLILWALLRVLGVFR